MQGAILFDFDGVIGKTMEDNFRAWKKALADFGVSIERDEYFLLEGMKLQELAGIFCRKVGIGKEAIPDIIKRKEGYYLKDSQFVLYPFVEEFITRLKEKSIPLGLVSAGLMERLRRTVPEGFLDNFGAVITGDMAGKGKPFPDPYKQAAQRLNAAPNNCIVVENAPLGIQAAKAAGAYCVAICSTLGPEMLQGADETVPEFKDLQRTLAMGDLLAT